MVKEWELEALPEKSPFEETRVTNSDGSVVVEFGYREIGVASPLEDDDVIAFLGNGRRMMIGYDNEGAYKYENP